MDMNETRPVPRGVNVPDWMMDNDGNIVVWVLIETMTKWNTDFRYWTKLFDFHLGNQDKENMILSLRRLKICENRLTNYRKILQACGIKEEAPDEQ